MKKKANYIILFSLIVFLSGCGNHIGQKMEEMKKEKTSQTDIKPKVTKHEKKTGKIINQPIENYSGNTLTMLDWVVMPQKMESNEEDKANFVFYYTIDKTVSEKLNPPSEFFSVFRIF
ncbi:hypothetical protein [Vagococcus bubulae]|uniref:Uncharacterized protein n=1 Tax=Vagococcus bubulae TaxID=1977868 RepID=A0A429ZNQ6_9ENTE|nr:hypothetical protein [Vagococcus bubulae]RST95321.1 hypothetical protein CBF36_03560 [Vagococcus bubulae]